MNKKEKDLAKKIDEKVKLAFDYKSEWTDQAKDNVENFMNGDWRKNKKKEYFVFIPLIYWAIKTKLARDLEPIYVPEDVIGINPVEPDDEVKAELNQHLVNFQFRKTPDIKLKMWMLHLQKRVCGTSPFRIFRDYKISKIKRFKKQNMLERLMDMVTGKSREKETETIVEEFNNLEVIDFFNFFIEPGAKSIDDAEYCGDKFKIKLSKLEKANEEAKKRGDTEKYINLAELKKAASDKNTKTTDEQEEGGQTPAKLADDETTVEVTNFWTEEKWVQISNGIIIKNIENPYDHGLKPYGNLNNDPELNEFYGRGDPELLECLNNLYNRI